MQYVLEKTVYDEATSKYNLEDNLIANVKKSKSCLEPDPELRSTNPEN